MEPEDAEFLAGAGGLDDSADVRGLPREDATLEAEPLHEDDEVSAEDASEDDLSDQQPEAGSPINQTFDVEAQRDVTILTQILGYDPDKPDVRTIHRKTIQGLTRIFVEPPGYAEFLARARESNERVFIVHGARGTGKWTCGVNLSCALFGSDLSEVLLYLRRDEERRALVDVIKTLRAPRKSAVILENAFDKSVTRDELMASELHDLREVLRDRELLLILTTQLELRALEPLTVLRMDATHTDMAPILRKHLDYALGGQAKQRVIPWIEEKWRVLREILSTPIDIERFSASVSKKLPRNAADLENLARMAALVEERAMRPWFNELTGNEKLLALLVYLFGGVGRSYLEGVYTTAAAMLHSDGVTSVRDARELGLEDILETILGQESGGFIGFKDGALEDEVSLQTANWGHLLWPVLGGLVLRVSQAADSEDWQQRRGLGIALARLSVGSRGRFEELLESLASNPSHKIAVIAGYALEESVRRASESMGSLALRKLRCWIDSGEPNLMWAAGSAISQVFSATYSLAPERGRSLREGLMGLLERLIAKSSSFAEEVEKRLAQGLDEGDPVEGSKGRKGNVDERRWGLGRSNRSCSAVTALRVILQEPSRVSMLGKWLQRGKGRAWETVAYTAIELVFKVLGQSRTKPDKTRYSPVLGLVESLLEARGQGRLAGLATGRTLLTLRSWLRWEEWREAVFSALLELANRGSADVRWKLRGALARYWLEGDPVAQGIAEAVIARSYAMDGVLMEGPKLGRGVFVLDPVFLEGDKEKRERNLIACRQLLASISAQVDVTLVQLGSRGGQPLGAENDVAFASDHAVPRFLMPALDTIGIRELGLVCVLTSGPIWDFADAVSRPWADNLFLIASADASAFEGVEAIQIGSELESQDIQRIEKAFRTRWAQALPRVEPDRWLAHLQSFGVGREVMADTNSWLETKVRGLEDTTQALGQEDLGRCILLALCWYASVDLQGCASLLRTWLEDSSQEGEGALRRSMGAAGAKALLRLHAAERPASGSHAPRVLFEELAYPLARQGKDGVQVVLEAIRKWIEDAVWAIYFASDVEEGSGRLLRWAEEFVPQHVEALRSVLPKVPDLPEEVRNKAREALEAVFDRLRLRMALGSPKILPDLADGERYGLILLDTSEADAKKRAELAGLASRVFDRLTKEDRRLKPVIFRFGERQPAWVAGDPVPPPEALTPREAQLPRLLGPILCEARFSPETVDFLLLLCTRYPHDADDWIATPWRERVLIYPPGGDDAFEPSFTAFPTFTGDTASAIARHLTATPAEAA